MVIPVGYGQANFRFQGTQAPTGAEVTFGLEGSGFAGDPVDAAVILAAHWANTWSAIQTNQIALIDVLVKFGPDTTGPSGTAPGAGAGSITSSGASPAVSLLVQKLTALGGRAGKGRCFIPGISEADVGTQGTIDSAYLAACQTEFDSFLLACSADDLSLVLLHSAGSPITTPTPITGLAVQGLAATQRRRQRR